MKTRLNAIVFGLLLGIGQVNACDLSDLTLDSVVCKPNGFEIWVTLCIGAGTNPGSSNPGAGGPTFDFGFFLFGNANLTASSFTPTVTSDTTAATYAGVAAGPALGAQSVIVYSNQGASAFACINSSSFCGLPHRECHQFFFTTNVLPDSICAWGVEGSGNPLAGCYGNTDMCIGTFPLTSGLSCPPDQQVYVQSSNCMAVGNWTPPAVNQLCASLTGSTAQPGDSFAVGISTVTYSSQINGGGSDSCSFTIEVLDTLAPFIQCPGDTTLLVNPAQSCQAFYQAPVTASDQCQPVNLQQSSGPVNQLYSVGITTSSYVASDPSGNSDSCSFTVTVQRASALVADFSFQQTLLQFQFSDISTGGAQSWQWDFGDTGSSTQQNPSHSYASAGVFTVCLIVGDSCGFSDTTCITVSPITGTEPAQIAGLSISPNPSRGQFQLEWETASYGELEIFDLRGKAVRRQAWEDPRNLLLISGISPGLYVMRVHIAGKSTHVKVLVQE